MEKLRNGLVQSGTPRQPRLTPCRDHPLPSQRLEHTDCGTERGTEVMVWCSPRHKQALSLSTEVAPRKQVGRKKRLF